jgi:hypothetical protein
MHIEARVKRKKTHHAELIKIDFTVAVRVGLINHLAHAQRGHAIEAEIVAVLDELVSRNRPASIIVHRIEDRAQELAAHC